MLTLRDALFGLVLPALVGTVFFFVGRRKVLVGAPAEDGSSDASAALPYALASGYLLGDAALFGGPRLPPVEAIEWVFGAAIAMLVVTLVFQFVWRQPWAWFVAIGVVFGATIYEIARPLVEHSWNQGESIAWIAGCWIAAMAVSAGLAGAVRKERGVAIVAAQAIVLMIGAAVVMMSGSQTFGQKAATLPAALAPMALLAIITRTNLSGPELAPMFVLLFGGVLLCTHWYSELTAVNAALLFFAPLGVWIGNISVIAALKNWRRAAIQLAAVVIPAAIAFALALAKFLADIAERSAYGY
jgi:hypothetical protein